MRLSRASSYGVMATTHIAEREKDSPIPGQNIAQSCSIPPGHLLKVLQQLVKARILTSERGPSGGFSLRRTPSKISLQEIIEAIEGPIEGEVAGQDDITGKGRAKGMLKKACEDVAKSTRTIFNKVSVSDLVG